LSGIIHASGLTKRYQDLTAVNGISFDIPPCQCFAILGPNGAGKTSTIKMITCTSPITEGELWVDGKEVRRQARAIKSVLGVVSQADSLDPDLNVMQNLAAYGRFFNLPSATARQRGLELLELFQLQDKLKQRPDELSGGMRRRLLIARALLHEPKILVLDEPTTGLDPQTRLLVWEKLSLLKSQGITILLTTHHMDEAAQLCDRIIILDHGIILDEGTTEELISRHVGGQVVEIRGPREARERLAQGLAGPHIFLEERGDAVLVFGDVGNLDSADWEQEQLQVTRRPTNLEDVFLHLTGRGLREE
jgi:lipooligosaccharide transport system ATP-binding protein